MTMDRDQKIIPLVALADLLAGLRDGGRTRIVHCHGVFDLLHIGHIRHFQQAKQLGDLLVVTVTPDQYVNKGPHRPAFHETLRAEAIAALDCVDYVALNRWPTAVETIRLLRPDFYVKGAEYQNPRHDLTGNVVEEQDAVRSVGGELVFTDDDVVFSSSSLINRYFSPLGPEVHEFLAGFARRHPPADVLRLLDGARGFRALVVGEAIIDEYVYCDPIGKAAKEPVLAVRYESTERFAGGALAVANHVAHFCETVGLVTMLGEDDPQNAFVQQGLHDRVHPTIIYKAQSPTITKTRYVDSYLQQKLFEVYRINDADLDGPHNEALCDDLERMLPDYDVVIVADYGHGMLTPGAVEVLARRARFLAVNTQANAGNHGFNAASKYPRAEYVTMTRHEIALEERGRRRNIREMMQNVRRRLGCDRILVTLGKDGNIGYSEADGFVETPAFAYQVVDRIGAGDAVLALTALCVAQGAPMEVVGFVGNAVGAQAVATVGHRASIERVPLSKFIESLLK